MAKDKNTRLYLLLSWMVFTPWVSTLVLTQWIIGHEYVVNEFDVKLWTLFFMLSAITMGLAITPTTFIALVCGYFLGFESALYVVVSYQAASFIGYFLGRLANENFIEAITTKYAKAQEISHNIDRNQWKTVFLARLSPALPFGVMNIVLSVSGIRPMPFFVGGLLGMLPRTLFFLWVGAQAPRLITALESDQHFFLGICITLGILFIMFKVLKPKP